MAALACAPQSYRAPPAAFGGRGASRASPAGPRRPRAAVVAAAVRRTGLRQEAAGGRFKETFAFDLLGLGKWTEETVESAAGSEHIALEIPRPMGIIFEEPPVAPGDVAAAAKAGPPPCVVVELVPGGNGEKAGVRVGDVLKLSTAVLVFMDKVDVVSFYANPPKKSNRRGLFNAAGQPFEKSMKALLSNGEVVVLPDGTPRTFETVSIVLERPAAM